MKKLFLFIFIAIGIAKITNGQSHVFKKYTVNDGLPSSETYCVIQDQKGYMWFATDRGIAKFDGYNFKVFTTNNGLPDNTVFEFFIDEGNRLWFKTVSSEMGYIQNDSVYNYPYNHLIRSLLPGQILRNLLFTAEGHLSFTHQDGSLIKFFEINHKGKLDSSNNIIGRCSKRIYVNRRGEKIITGDMDSKSFEIYLQETNEMLGSYTAPSHCGIFFFSPSKKGNGYFAFINNIIFHINKGICKKIGECNGEDILSLFADKDDDLWVGYRYIGFDHFSAKNGYKKELSGLNNSSISSIHQDNEGGLWFTSLENGVHYLAPLQLLSYTEEHGLSIAKTNKIEKIDDGVFAILSNNSVLYKPKNDSQFKVVRGKSHLYFDASYDQNKTLYLIELLYGNDVVHIPKNKIFLRFSKKIHVGYKYIWAYDYSRIIKYEKNGTEIEIIQASDVERIMCVYEQMNGDLLIGTTNGLVLYKDSKAYPLKNENPLLKYRISDISFSKGNIFIATIGKGLIVVKGNDFAHAVQYTTDDGLPSIMCNVILPDTGSVVWIGTNRGLCRMEMASGNGKPSFLNMDINDGVVSNEINDLVVIGDDLWVATSKGITIIPREKIADKLPDIPMYIEGMLVNGVNVATNITRILSYNQNNISIYFTGLHYSHAGKLQYKYRINGDTNWYYTTNRSVVFNGLQPGEYTFEVGVFKPNGKLNPLWAKYSFIILPPFWQTWWFNTLAILLTIGVLTFIIYRIIILKRDGLYKKEQQNRKLAQLELEAIKAQINPHFIYNCLNSIQYFNYKSDYVSVKKYFSMLARLIRQTMKFSHETFITLDAEVNYLTNYLELEKIRYKEKLNYHFTVSETLSGSTLLPAMLIQPYIENALKHGIANLNSNGNVWVNFTEASNGWLLVTIEDNGPGLSASTDNIDEIHFGNRLTEGRITSYNQLFALDIVVKVAPYEPSKGLRVEITIPPVTNEDKALKNAKNK